jgi:cellulose synthase/poly-beta-1,6-N-acetylglucosamine synthase-like glycosyltransferase
MAGGVGGDRHQHSVVVANNRQHLWPLRRIGRWDVTRSVISTALSKSPFAKNFKQKVQTFVGKTEFKLDQTEFSEFVLSLT